MKIKLLISVLFFLSCKIATAQWTNQVASPWVYNFTAGTDATVGPLTAVYTNTSADALPFLPVPPTGTSRVYMPYNNTNGTTGGVYTLDKTSNTLTMVPVAGSGTSKFSAYNIAAAGSIATITTTVIFGKTSASAPTITTYTPAFIIGNRAASSNVFNNASSGFNATGGGTQNSLFTSVRFTYSPVNNNYAVNFRVTATATAAASYTSLSGGELSEGLPYKIEAFCNNSPVSKTYIKSTISYTVNAGAYHLWITQGSNSAVRYYIPATLGPPATPDIYDIPKSVESTSIAGTGDLSIASNEILNSFLIQAGGNTGNLANITINGGMSAAYDLSTLPVSLTSFKGDLQNNEVALNWRTASEQNNSYFELLRAGEDKNFVSIAKVNGNGTKNEVSDYYYTDKSPLAGNNYYQLKQVDFDGKSTIHENVVVVKSGFATTSLAIMSNADNGLKVNIQADQKSKGTLTLFNINGQKVFEANVVLNQGFNEFNYQTLSIEKGVYIAKVSAGSLQLNKKFLKN
jgi:hypothetical protein